VQSKRAAVRLCCCCGLLERLVALVELFEQLLLHLVVAEPAGRPTLEHAALVARRTPHAGELLLEPRILGLEVRHACGGVADDGRELLGRLEEEVELPLVRDEEEELCGRW